MPLDHPLQRPDFQFLQRESLKNIDLQQIESFVKTIRDYYGKKSIEDRKKRPLVLTIDAGGTISMRSQKSELVGEEALIAQSQDYENIIKDIVPPDVLKPFNEHVYKFVNFPAFSLDSSDMESGHISDLVTLVSLVYQDLESVKGLEIAGATIMMGTDKMAEVSTRFAMQMGKNLPFPVVFTGAQKPITDPGSDAQQNVTNSIRTITTMNGIKSGQMETSEKKREVVVCFGSGVYRAVGADKFDAVSSNGINSKLFEPIGTVTNGVLHDIAKWAKKAGSGIFTPRPLYEDDKSLKVKVLPELDTDFNIKDIEGFIKERVGAILLLTNASGAVNKKHFEALQGFCQEHGKLLMVTNQTAPLLEADYETAKLARETHGVIFLTMTRWAVQAKFKQFCAQYGNDLEKVASAMQKDFIGEIPNQQNRRNKEKNRRS